MRLPPTPCFARSERNHCKETRPKTNTTRFFALRSVVMFRLGHYILHGSLIPLADAFSHIQT